jgi:hypothetical protein
MLSSSSVASEFGSLVTLAAAAVAGGAALVTSGMVHAGQLDELAPTRRRIS